MKNSLIVLFLFAFTSLYGQGMLYVFSTYATDQYTSDTDTTMLYVSNENVCLFNKDYSYCDAILSPTDYTMTETPLEMLNTGKTVIITQVRIQTDAVPYTILWEDYKLQSASLTSFKGEPIYLMGPIAEREVQWSVNHSRTGNVIVDVKKLR